MSIFVSIACFMDKDIINTIEDCLKKAKNSNQIVFGICLQYDKNDDFLKKYDNNPQFKIHRMDWKNAKGPTYARYLISNLINNEDYFLQIDCHTRFFENWDEIAISCLKECNDNKSILTAFPISIKNMHEKNYPLNKSPRSFRLLSTESIITGSYCCHSNKPELTYNLSAAFLFGKINFIKEVKYDPVVTFSFQKIEQQFYAIRLFTHGWNLYMPTKHIVSTFYEKMPHYDSNNKRIYPPCDVNRGEMSWKRVLYYYGLLSIEEVPVAVKTDIEKYGLGSKRTLNEFFKIHNQENAIQNLKNGLIYSNGKWSKFTFNCKNNIFIKLLSNNEKFIEGDENNKVDFNWNIQPKNINSKFQHYLFQSVSFIDNKYEFFKLLKNNNIVNGIPKTYFHVDEIKNFNKNYFLKYAHVNGGKSVNIVRSKNEIKELLKKNKNSFIIQEEVPNMLLIDEKKHVLRIYILIVNNEFYITTNGYIVLQKNNYNATSNDRQQHIEHDLSWSKNYEYKSHTIYKNTFDKVVELFKNICFVINNKLIFKNNCFQVLGIDVMFDNNYDPYILEINSWPNMNFYQGNGISYMNEFFTNFLNNIVIPKLENKPLIESYYFKKLNLNSQLYNNNNIQSTIFTRNEPKILILILSSNGVYEETNKLSEQTWLKEITNYKNMQYFFYYGKNNSKSKDANKIFTNNDETRNKILNKTIDVFKYVNKNIEFDYILRLCACSYVDLKKLNNFVKTLENRKIFSGPFNNTSEGADKRYNLKREPFITGANMLFSKDVVDFIVKNETLLDYAKYGHADDLNISMIINSHYILKSQWLNQAWININDTSINYCEQLKNNNFYHYHYNHNKFKQKLLEFHKNYTFNT